MADWLHPDAKKPEKKEKKKGGGGILGLLKRAPGNAIDKASDVVPKQVKKVGGAAVHDAAAVSRAAHLPQGTNALLTAIDKPGQAVRAAYLDSKDAQRKNKSELNQVGAFFSGFGKGFVGKEHTTGTQVASSFLKHGDRNKIKKLPWGVDTGISVGLDPTSYVSFGASSAAKSGVEQVGKQFGTDVAERVVQDGTKALTDIQRKQLHTALRRQLVESGGAKSVQAADRKAAKILTAMDKSGQGGLKFAGRTVVPAESPLGHVGQALNPKRQIGKALGASETGRDIKGIFIRGAHAEHVIGKDATKQLIHDIDATGTSVGHQQDVVDAAAQHVAKGVDMSDPETRSLILKATDIASENEPLQQARAGEKAAGKVAKQGEKEVKSHRAKLTEALQKSVREQAAHEGKSQITSAAKEAEHTAILGVKDAAIKAQEDRTILARLNLQSEGSKAAQRTYDAEHKRLAKLVEDRSKFTEKHSQKMFDLEDKAAEKAATIKAKHAAKITDMIENHEFLKSLENSAVDRHVSSQIAVQESANTPTAMAALEAQGKPQVAHVVDFIDKQRRKWTDAQRTAGLGGEHWDELTPEYVPRYLTKQGKKALKERRAQVAEALGKPGRPLDNNTLEHLLSSEGHTAARTLYPNLNIEQINKLMVDRGAMKEGEKFFDDNALTATVRRTHDAVAAVEHSKLLDRLATQKDNFGKPLIQPVDEKYVAKAGEEILDHVGSKGTRYAARPEVKKLLNEAAGITYNDESLRAFTHGANRVTAMWRSLATAGPAFHARNEAGNFWLNWLAGVKNPAAYAKATQLQLKLHAVMKHLGPEADFEAALKSAGLDRRERQLLSSALDKGVIDRGFFHTDLPRPVITGEKNHPLRRLLGGANQVNRKVGSAVENNARMAHYIDKVGKLGSEDAAANSVKKYLFDYSDLTATERHKLKSVMPFYTFMRKNVPLEIEKAFTEPRKFSLLNHADQELRQRGVEVRPDLPTNNVQDVLNAITAPTASAKAQAAFQPVSPFIKVGLETATHRSAFNGYELRTPKALRENALRQLIPPYAKVTGAGHQPISKWLVGLTKSTATLPDQPKKKKKKQKPGSWLHN